MRGEHYGDSNDTRTARRGAMKNKRGLMVSSVVAVFINNNLVAGDVFIAPLGYAAVVCNCSAVPQFSRRNRKEFYGNRCVFSVYTETSTIPSAFFRDYEGRLTNARKENACK